VTLLLSTALQKIQADFVVTKDPTPTTNKESTGEPDIVAFKKAIPNVVLELSENFNSYI